MQYFRPGGGLFVGDCMPFWHENVYHLLYLLDQGHHQGRGGLGGHQWAHASTTDLIHWTHHPLALSIEHEWEGSICTGSVYARGETFHAFFATRMRDHTQHLGRAVSADGIHFTKCEPNPFFSPPAGYDANDCRDPFVFQGKDGVFHLLVTARRTGPAFPEHNGGGGCLLHLVSDDLFAWTLNEEPFFVPGGEPGGTSVPECPDYFFWNGWYYLLFGQGLQTRYRLSRQPFGAWEKPCVDVLDSPKLAVMKTAPFGAAGRRIGAAWLGSRQGDQDTGAMLWGGNLVLRELVQNADGTLGTRFVAEQRLPVAKTVPPLFQALTPDVVIVTSPPAGTVLLHARQQAREVALLEGVPPDMRVRVRVRPGGGCHGRFGLGLRASGNLKTGYVLGFDPGMRKAWLADETIEGVEFLGEHFDLEVVCRGDILDANIGGRRCLINRLPQARGASLFLFAENGNETAFDVLAVEVLEPPPVARESFEAP